MKYCNLKEMGEMAPIDNAILPFLKRDTFKAEAEYRIVAWEEDWLAGDVYFIPMPAKYIRKVILGPEMPDGLANTLKDLARSIDGCSEIEFTKSRLVNNARWQEVLNAAAKEIL